MKCRPNQVHSNKSRAVFDIGGSSVLIKILLFMPYLKKTVPNAVFRNENNNTVSRNLHLHTGP